MQSTVELLPYWRGRRYLSRSATLLRAALIGLETAAGLVFGPLLSRIQPQKPLVVFQAYASHLAIFYGSLIRRLQREGRVQVVFVQTRHPHFPMGEQIRLRQLATQRLGLERDSIVPYWKTLWWDVGLWVAVDVAAVFPLRRTRRCLLLHGVATGAREYRKHPWRFSLYDFDVVIAGGDYDRDLILASAAEKSIQPHVHAVGVAEFDRFHPSAQPSEEYLARMDFDPDRSVVLFAPHWQDFRHDERNGVARFHAVVSELMQMPVQLIIKPHQMILVPAACSGVKWEAVFRHYEQIGIRVDWQPDDYDALAYADVLVTGRSSRSLLFMLLGKPVIIFPLEPPSEDTIEQTRQELICSAAATAASVSEIRGLVENALQHPDELRLQRQRVTNRFFSNPGGATREACEAIYRELGLNDEPASTGRRPVHNRDR